VVKEKKAMLARRIGMIAAATGVLAGGGLWLHQRAEARDRPAYRFVTVEKGDLEVQVSATGKLEALRTVQVGTQVSGQIAEIDVDYNDQVKKGQLLARIDPTLARQAVADAEAGLTRALAEQAAAQQEEQRNRLLVEEGLLAPSAFEPMQTRQAMAKAGVATARVAGQRARQNLAYTEIRSPIDGVVVERNVNVGQTVAASLAAPQLFLIANDLSRMQIVVSVDESDIASIHEGQKARFTVQARPRERFEGRVEQVRLQSTTLENVVSYGVVVTLDNPDMKLLPGMTARVDFQVDSAHDVLKVANAALRFRPEGAATSPAASASPQAGRAAGATGAERRPRERPADRLWTWHNGTLKAIPVRVGLTDGVMTEVRGDGLEAGLPVIAGVQTADAAAPAGANPLQPRFGGGATRRPGGGF
jgi:HlyD family secretion protein